MKKAIRLLLFIATVLCLLYLLGPAPARPVYNPALPDIPADPAGLEQAIAAGEAAHRLKPDNEARIVWLNDSAKTKTPYSIVYLHGFSASQEEGDPTHRDIARKFGCNLYLARLSDHGIDTTQPLYYYTADRLWESAKRAYAIGKQLGEKVILMGTSTGGSVALQLAAAYPEVAGLVLISPNIEINDPNAPLLNNHWGKQIARLVLGSNMRLAGDERPIYKQYWNSEYRIEALVNLQEYMETAMVPATFSAIQQPALTLAYYKNEQEQDKVVKVAAMRNMYEQLGTAPAMKKLVQLSTTGDHVQGSPIKSKDVEGLKKEISGFMQEVMQMQPVQ